MSIEKRKSVNNAQINQSKQFNEERESKRIKARNELGSGKG